MSESEIGRPEPVLPQAIGRFPTKQSADGEVPRWDGGPLARQKAGTVAQTIGKKATFGNIFCKSGGVRKKVLRVAAQGRISFAAVKG